MKQLTVDQYFQMPETMRPMELVTEGMHERSKAVPVAFSVPLAGLEPGRYDVQVTILEPGGQKAAFWRAPIAVIP